MTAIRAACEALGTFSLKGCEIFTSCEPCPMCLAAIYWARLDRITFANSRQDAAAIGFDDALIYGEVSKPIEDRVIPTTKLELPEAAVFATRIDNEKTRVYSRETGLLVRPDPDLESLARREAERQIRQAAIDGGILIAASSNARATLTTLLQGLGFKSVQFVQGDQ